MDTGYTTTMVRSSLLGERIGESWMSAFDGRKVRCGGGKARESRSAGNPCGGQCSSNRAPGRGPRSRPRYGCDRAWLGTMGWISGWDDA